MKELICIICPRGCHLKVDESSGYAVTGNNCPRGAEYGREELIRPARVITSTVRCRNGAHPRCPVKTSAPVPKSRIFEAVAQLDGVILEAPVTPGQVVLKNVCGTGADFVTTRALPRADQDLGGTDHE